MLKSSCVAKPVKIRSEDENAAKTVESLLLQLSDLVTSGQSFEDGALKFIIHAFHDDPFNENQ